MNTLFSRHGTGYSGFVLHQHRSQHLVCPSLLVPRAALRPELAQRIAAAAERLRRSKNGSEEPADVGDVTARGGPDGASTSSLNSNASDIQPSRQKAEPKSPLTQEQLDEKEKERRARISEANAGKVPWNKGRKHSAETIAKIRERTKAAMYRPDVYSAYKEGVAKHLAKKAEEKANLMTPEELAAEQEKKAAKAKPKATKKKEPAYLLDENGQPVLDENGEPVLAPKKKRASRAKQTTAAEGEDGATSTAEGDKPKRGGSKKKKSEGDAGQEPTDPSVPKPKAKRKPPSPEHRAAIAAAIRAKWQDPAYRAKTLEGIHEHVRAITGNDPNPRRRSGGSSTSGSSKPRASSGSSGSTKKKAASEAAIAAAQAAAELSAREAWLKQVEGFVARVLDMRKLIMKMDLTVEDLRVKQTAFTNDPRNAARAEAMIQQTEASLAVARQKLKTMESQLPGGMQYSTTGSVQVTDPDVFFKSVNQALAAQRLGNATSSANSNEQTQDLSSTSNSSPVRRDDDQEEEDDIMDEGYEDDDADQVSVTSQLRARMMNSMNIGVQPGVGQRRASPNGADHIMQGTSLPRPIAGHVGSHGLNGHYAAGQHVNGGIAGDGAHMNGYSVRMRAQGAGPGLASQFSADDLLQGGASGRAVSR